MSNTTTLQKKDDFSLLNLNNANDELGETISFYKIQQKQNNGYKVGKFTSTTGKQLKDVEFIWLAMSRSRVLWPEFDPNVATPQPLCRSMNGMESCNGTEIRSALCKDCPEANWIDGKPPRCAQVFNMLCWDTRDLIPFVFAIKRTFIRPLKLLKTQMRERAAKIKQDYPIHLCIKIKMTVEKKPTHFLPRFTITSTNTKKEIEHFYSIARKITLRFPLVAFPEPASQEAHTNN